jgi:predicted TIM-barrel fold metal-dependent hydrolase
MNVEDLILVSVDDHICEPANMFEAHVPKKYRESAPRVVTDSEGTQRWFYGEIEGRNIGVAAAAGKPKDQFAMDPTNYEDMRPGCYIVSERVRDMDAGGVLAALCFPNWTGFAGQVLNIGPDLHLNEIMIKAYNDWHVDEWCGSAPDRFIPCGILPLFDPELAANEIHRLASKGCHAVTFTENFEGTPQATHTIHSRHWDPIWQACVEEGTVVSCHLGTSPRQINLAPGDPISLIPGMYFHMMSMLTFGDLLWADFWDRYPDLKIAVAEGDVGWMPYFIQRAEIIQDMHSSWTKKVFIEGGPKAVFDRHILCCFIDDRLGIELLDRLNVDNVMWESDFPHADTAWPYGPEKALQNLAGQSVEVINKITHLNAMRHYQFDPFATRPQSECTVAALRSRATDVDVVTRVGKKRREGEDATAVFATGSGGHRVEANS